MISYFYRSVREENLNEAARFRTGSWIYVENPNAAELELLAQKFDMDTDLLNDALDPDEIARIEVEGDNVYVYMRFAERAGENVETDPVLLIIGPKFTATIVRHALPGLERFKSTPELYTTQRTKVLLQLMRHVIGTYELNARYLSRQIRGVRAKMSVANVSNRDFVQFVAIEDALNSFLAELVPTNLLLTGLLSGSRKYGLTFHEDDTDLIEDLQLATRQLTESSRSSLRTIVNIRDAYSNIMTNNLNRRVELLTSLTVILTIPTMVFSLWGMNVPVPGQHFPHAFALITLSVIISIGGVLYWLYKKKLL